MQKLRSHSKNNHEDSDTSVKSDSSTKRRLESPEKQRKNKPKKVKLPPQTMGSQRDEFSISSEQWNVLMTQLGTLTETMKTQTEKIDTLVTTTTSIDNRLKTLETSQKATDKRVNKLKKIVNELQVELDSVKADNNHLNQVALSKDFVIFGLSYFEKDKTDQIINSLSHASGVQFTKSDLQNFYPVRLRKDKKKCIVHGRFYDEKLKTEFISGWRSNKPIVVEDVMQLKANDTSRGTEIFIRNQLTNSNRELSAEARLQRNAGKLKYVWEKDGRILIRKSDNSPIIEIRSMNQLMSLITAPQREVSESSGDDSDTMDH